VGQISCTVLTFKDLLLNAKAVDMWKVRTGYIDSECLLLEEGLMRGSYKIKITTEIT
jgi:hypothetical protein